MPDRPRHRSLILKVCCTTGIVGLTSRVVRAQDAAPPRAATPASAAAESRRPARPVTANAPHDTATILQRNGGSLLRASMASAAEPGQARMADVSFFAVPEPEPRTIKKHDIITVIVREESAFSSKGSADLKREQDIEAKIDEFIKLKLGNFAIQGGAQGANPPSIKGSVNREFKGEGTVDRSDSLTARITGEVLDVKPNGTLVVQARKQIKTDEEEQTFILTGICRAEDVNADNTVLSTQMFDLQLQKNHKGAVRDATKRGWLIKLLDAVSPL